MTSGNNSNSNFNSRPWDKVDLLNRRKEVVPLLEELGFLALLETLVAEAHRPVNPTATNWLVQRAMQDGGLEAVEYIRQFFDETAIQARIQQKVEEEKRAQEEKNHVSPFIKPVNPYR